MSDILRAAGADIACEMQRQLALGKDPVTIVWTAEDALSFLRAVTKAAEAKVDKCAHIPLSKLAKVDESNLDS